MATTIIRPTSREQWLSHRRAGIGSSEVATIVGLNPYDSPYQLWRRKKGLDQEKEETFLMTAGHYLEDAVSRFFEDETGHKVIKSSAGDWLIQDSDKPYLQVSPDRTYWLGESRSPNAKGILECKTTQKEIDKDDLPKHWFCQLQYQLGVAGFAQGALAWLTQGNRFGQIEVDFVPDFYEWLKEEVTKFYTDYIVGDQEPAAVSVADIMAKYASHTDGKVAEADEEVFAAYTKLKGLRDKITEFEAQKKALEDKLKLHFADAEALTYGGQTIATWKQSKNSVTFDHKRYAAEHPDLVLPYMSESAGSRRFCLK